MADKAVTVTTNTDSVPAQVAGKPQEAPTQVDVHEVSVTTDVVILDPNSDLAVQIPDEGRGDASLPIHRLSEPSPEEALAKSGGSKAKSSDKPSS